MNSELSATAPLITPSLLHDVGIAIVGSILTAIGFIAKRYFTQAAKDELLNRKERVLTITRSMGEQNLTLEQLHEIEERLTVRRRRLTNTSALEQAAEPLDQVLRFHPMTQGEMNRLASQEAHLADQELEALYADLFQQLAAEPARQQKLRDSQERWIAFRDAQASLARSEAEGGTMAPLLYSIERETLTRERIAQLKRTI
jgi:uncharacterized protein YecT (DUF1311 family)